MSRLHDDLLAQANRLAHLEPRRPRQASFRRAVSSAYYALFHLLAWEASRLYAQEPALASRINRTLNHGGMRTAANNVMKGEVPRSLRPPVAAKSPYSNDLTTVAAVFIALQQQRHEADYDLMRKFSRQEVFDLITLARDSFEAWARIRGTDEARVFLASLHLWDAWNKPPR